VRPRALADEVRRRLEPGTPADAAARQQCDALGACEPGRRLGRVARVRVLGHEADERALEPLVQRREEQGQDRLRDTGARRQRRGIALQPLVLEQLADKRVQGWPVHDV
jgi:hypothetical protein